MSLNRTLRTLISRVEVGLPLRLSQLQLQQIILSALTRNDTTGNRSCATINHTNGTGIQAVNCSSPHPVICEQPGKTVSVMLNGQVSKFVVFTATLIAWSRYNSHSIHILLSPCIDALRWLFSWLESNKNLRKSAGILDHWKILSRHRFLQARSTYHYKKCARYPIAHVRRCLVTEG